MIDNEYLKEIGLSEDQITILKDALKRERQYRKLLLQEGISPSIVENVVEATKNGEIDFLNEDLLREKVRAEWGDLVVKKRDVFSKIKR